MIERIEVIRGPPRHATATAAGGVVNIITKKATTSGTVPGTPT
jgi:outer membrane receptor for ferrienterochelin and colicin